MVANFQSIKPNYLVSYTLNIVAKGYQKVRLTKFWEKVSRFNLYLILVCFCCCSFIYVANLDQTV